MFPPGGHISGVRDGVTLTTINARTVAVASHVMAVNPAKTSN